MRRPVPYHPLLFTAFPVLSLLAANATRVPTGRAVGPLLVVLGATAALFALLALLVRDRFVAAAAASLIAVLALSYGHVARALAGAGLYSFPQDDDWLLAVFALTAATGMACVLALVRVRWQLTRALNNIGVVLVVVSLVPFVTTKARSELGSRPTAQDETLALTPDGSAPLPDIYYLVFDRYARHDTLVDEFGFDNSQFLDELGWRGFLVADRSLSNYQTTAHSLASTLNMEYISPSLSTGVAHDVGPVFQILREHRVGLTLKAAGYRYVHVGPTWEGTGHSPISDEDVGFDPLSELDRALYRNTILYPLGARFGVDFTLLDNRRTLYELTRHQLAKVSEARRTFRGQPTFVFSHFIVPHPPYVFGEDGKFVDEATERAKGEDAGYLDQLRYVNAQILQLLDTLLADDGRPKPVVIIQSDEGPHPRRQERHPQDFSWTRATLDEQRTKFRILNAYYLPGDGEDLPYRAITPVNTFRLVLNRYLGASLPLLKDESYVFPPGHLYKFTRINRSAVVGDPRVSGTDRSRSP